MPHWSTPSLMMPTDRPGRAGVPLIAALLFASVFVLRLGVTEPEAGLGFMFVLPIALLALQFGAAAGLAGAGTGTALVVLWQAMADVELGVASNLSRVATFALIGGLLGSWADHQREKRRRTEERADQALQEADRRSETILEHVTDAFVAGQARPDSVVVADARSGEVMFSNGYAECVVGRRLSEIAADFPMFHLDGRPYSYAERQIPRSIGSGEEIIDEEFFGPGADGSRIRYRCSCWPVYSDGGEIVAAVAVTRDVTEQTRQQERLTYLAALLENTDDAVVAADERYFITVWNKGAERLYGWKAEEVAGLHADDGARINLNTEQRTALRRQLAEYGRWRGELAVTRKDGTTAEVEVISVATRGEQGDITGYLGIHRDISERKRIEEALREAHERSTTILESITDSFVSVDRHWRLTYLNERALAAARLMHGEKLSRSDLVGRNFWQIFPAGLGTRFDEQLHLALDERRTVHFEARAPLTKTWWDVHAYPSRDGLAIYSHDITERKRAEEALREAQRRSDAILDSISDDFFAVDRDWRYTYVNERALAQARKIVGRDIAADELLGTNIWQFLPEYEGTAFEREFHRVVREQRPVEFEAYSEATGRWLEMRAYPSKEGLSGYAHDISERKRAEEETRRRAEQQALVAHLGLRALAADKLQPLLDEAAGLVGETLDVEIVGIAEVLPDREQLLLRAGAGWTGGEVGEGTAFAGAGSLIHHTIVSGEPVVSEDLASDDRFEMSPLLARSGAVSGATVVIAGRDEPFGALGAFSRERQVFSKHDLDFLQAVANVLATAVERTQAETRLKEVREAERRRIARDLHDEALAELTHAVALAQGVRDAPDRLVPALKRVGQQVRGAIYDLRLEEQEGRRFPAQLRALVAVHGAVAADYDVELEIDDGTPTGPLARPGVELLRIAGEALSNACRHSGASHIRVKTWGSEHRICVEVSDDGVGFDPSAAPSGGGGMGITGMRERAGLVDADLTITSKPGAGTAVRVELALTEDEGPQPVRVLLVEDHAAVREAIAAMFEREPDFEVTGQAATLADARGLLTDVDVAVIDLGLPDGYGGDLIKELRDVNRHAQALVLSANLDRADIARAVESGAAGTLNKTAHLDDVVDAVRRLRAGETLLALDEVVELLRFAARRREQEHADRQALAQLTTREREILQGLAEGLDSQAIADRLHVSPRTERNHIANILAKLGVHSQLQALVFALRYGVVETRQPT